MGTLRKPLPRTLTLRNGVELPNEGPIREALVVSGVPRGDVFVTSKVSPYEQGAGRARTAVEAIMERIGVQYLDLVLVHWPGVSRVAPDSPLNAQMRWETWQELERLYSEGRVRAIGVSNYEERHLQELVGRAAVKPMVGPRTEGRWTAPGGDLSTPHERRTTCMYWRDASTT
ncbi:hypothetical protein Vafri_11842 [Volvox africanus]|uniref:NADP-dependent oxidoreductase domain-containing protein n=1 Tax=Volvox africanus TaxID=51714 RepID=A0A8J4F1T3_9CHLO|nr:hypothetical protein Vafri_11842 [Volvox africanus]